MEKALVIQVSRFDFADKQDGRPIKGCKVTYVSDQEQISSDRKGLNVITVTTSYSMYDSFNVVPGVYELDFAIRPGRGNKPTLQLSSVGFVSEAGNLLTV